MIKKIMGLKSYLMLRFKLLDQLVLAMAFILFAIGLLMIYSITGPTDFNFNNPAFQGHYFYVRQQAIMGTAGIVGMFILMLLPHKLLKGLGFPAMVVTALLMGLTLLIGQDGNNSDVRRWLQLGPFRFQPGEFARIGMIWAVAWLIDRLTVNKTYALRFSKKFIRYLIKGKAPILKKAGYFFKSYFLALFYIALISLLFISQPDLGSAITVAGIGMMMILSSGIPRNHVLTYSVLAILGGAGVFAFPERVVRGYQYVRFAVWRDPFSHPRGLQNVYGFASIALGGIFGVGLGESTQKAGFAIEAHTDFIITILAEELGLLMVLLVMALYFSIAVRCFLTALKGRSLFASMFCIGTGALFLVQPLINLGGASGFIPLTGITLPLLSFGGTSTAAIFLMLGVYFNSRIQIIMENQQKNLKEKNKTVSSQPIQLPKVIPFLKTQ